MATNNSTPQLDDLDAVAQHLHDKPWLIACLCAAWCDTCQAYRHQFNELSIKHQDKVFAWIDIEDHADLIDELDIENFPTILIEYQAKILFLGTMLPDANLVHKLVGNYQSIIEEKSATAIASSIQENNQDIDSHWNLSTRLRDLGK